MVGIHKNFLQTSQDHYLSRGALTQKWSWRFKSAFRCKRPLLR